MRTIGKIVALSVDASSHAAVTVGGDVREQCNTVALVNTGATVVALTFSNDTTHGAPATVLPADGTPNEADLVLPAAMTRPIIWNVPTCPFSVTAIGSASGPSIIYITPVQVTSATS